MPYFTEHLVVDFQYYSGKWCLILRSVPKMCTSPKFQKTTLINFFAISGNFISSNFLTNFCCIDLGLGAKLYSVNTVAESPQIAMQNMAKCKLNSKNV